MRYLVPVMSASTIMAAIESWFTFTLLPRRQLELVARDGSFGLVRSFPIEFVQIEQTRSISPSLTT
jgi:DNA-binding transcriptional LysR family regulator